MTSGAVSGPPTVVVTRAESPERGRLGCALRERGARVVHRPVLAMHWSESASLPRTVLDGADWVAITSARTVEGLRAAGWFDADPPAGTRVAAVGPSTAAAIRAEGWSVAAVPDPSGAEALVRLFAECGVAAGARVVLPGSARARPELADGLRRLGAVVECLEVYGPVPEELDPTAWRKEEWRALTFTSPSAVDAVRAGLPRSSLKALWRLPVGAQGPTTARAAREAGWREVVEAAPRTFDGLARTLLAHLASPSPPTRSAS
ncbi:uroporphyrinogen-III synthase [Gaopeijia maritima]|uniref:uroporphyrinogen-III synthase n=1 Tax=Gaopeijia maritima TaxID=3119007 RepID=UPI00324DA31E